MTTLGEMMADKKKRAAETASKAVVETEKIKETDVSTSELKVRTAPYRVSQLVDFIVGDIDAQIEIYGKPIKDDKLKQFEQGLLPEEFKKITDYIIKNNIELKPATGQIRKASAPEKSTEEKVLTPEATRNLDAFRAVLATLSFKKQTNSSLSSEDLVNLEWALREIQKILAAPENFKTKEKPISGTAPLENREVLAPGESFEVFTNDNGKFISIKRGRKIMIVDYNSAEPKPGSRTKVRIIRDTAPGERRGALIVEVVPEKTGEAFIPPDVYRQIGM